MTFRILATASVVAMLAACSGNAPRSAEASGDAVTYELVGTRWALVSLGNKAVTVSDGGWEVYIALNSVESSVVGHAGCNRISSSYQLNDAQLSFGEVIATRMSCRAMPTETALLQAMESTAAWRISGSQLELRDAHQKPLARFEARNF